MISTAPLTTNDLNSMLKCFDIFVGTFPSDKVPIQETSYPQAFIINTEPDHLDGDHWTALIVLHKKCLFFDPFGYQLLNLNLLESLKNKGITQYRYNSCQIQSIFSNNCGYFCAAFIMSFIHGYSYSGFMSNFVTKLKQNDRLCFLFIKNCLSKY